MNQGLAGARRTLPAPMHSANCKVWGRRNNLLFFMVRARPLSSRDGNLNATAYNYILDASNFVATVWRTRFPVSAWQCPCAHSEVHKEIVCRSVWKNLTSLLNPIEYLWDELKRRLQARPNHPTSVPDLTNTLVAEWKQVPTAMFQHLVESLSKRVEAVIAAKWGPTPY